MSLLSTNSTSLVAPSAVSFFVVRVKLAFVEPVRSFALIVTATRLASH